MRTLVFLLLVALSTPAFAQHYYLDVMGVRETSALMASYKKNNIHQVTAKSYDGDRKLVPTLQVSQFYDATENVLHTHASSERDEVSDLYTWANVQGQIIRSLDSNSFAVNETLYSYDAQGKLARLTTRSSDKTGSMQSTEEHVWIYNGEKPAQMLRIKNGADTTTVTFQIDKTGRVTGEQETHKGINSIPFYYYYSDNNLLTDIVRYRPAAKQELPVYMFEYSENGRLTQRITVPENNDYLKWKFAYNAGGLKTREAIYNKKNQLQGFIDYTYQ